MQNLVFSPYIAGIAPKAIGFAWKHLTPEGLSTIVALLIVSVFSWTVIISKARQLIRASKVARKFFAEYRATRDPLEMFRKKAEFDGAPAYELYITGAEEIDYHLKNNPVEVVQIKRASGNDSTFAETDIIARSISTKISRTSFESVQVALERAASGQAMSLERGMIILSTAVAGGPFIGLFGTVWGVMSHRYGTWRSRRPARDSRRPFRGHPCNVCLQLHGNDHPGHHPGTGPLLLRVRHRPRA